MDRLRMIRKDLTLTLMVAIALTGQACLDDSSVDSNAEDQLEEGEADPGGAASSPDHSSLAFSYPVDGLSSSELDLFAIGNSLFQKNWISAPATATARDGLGPLFNEASCSTCHFMDGRDEPRSNGKTVLAPLFRVGQGVNPYPGYGTQLQVQSLEGVAPEVEITVTYQDSIGQYGDGSNYELQIPTYSFINEAYGSLAGAGFSPRIGPAVFGGGLLEGVPLDSLKSWADENDIDQDGISGRIHWISTDEGQVPGRFGWKADASSLEAQTAEASFHDMGLSNPLHPKQNCQPEEIACNEKPTGNDEDGLELDKAGLESIVFYLQGLSVPTRRSPMKLDVTEGKILFNEINCQICHRPTAVTNHSKVASLSGQKIYMYTDLLLHNMGSGLSDTRKDSFVQSAEWKTPPLWGLGLVPVVNGHTRYLHDGRARDLNEAILWHGGEAKASQKAYTQLKQSERDAVIEFLESL